MPAAALVPVERVSARLVSMPNKHRRERIRLKEWCSRLYQRIGRNLPGASDPCCDLVGSVFAGSQRRNAFNLPSDCGSLHREMFFSSRPPRIAMMMELAW
jgi:hypothetical protein